MVILTHGTCVQNKNKQLQSLYAALPSSALLVHFIPTTQHLWNQNLEMVRSWNYCVYIITFTDIPDSTAKAITEGLIKPSERTRFQETRGRTTEMLIPMQKGKAGKPRASEGFKPKKKLSRKEIAQMGIYALPEDTIRYQQVVPLHRLWCGYMARYLGKEKLPDVIESQYTQFA